MNVNVLKYGFDHTRHTKNEKKYCSAVVSV